MVEPTYELQAATLPVVTQGGQLSKTTDWTVMQELQPLCEIKRENWKLRWWTYKATIRFAGATYEATSDASNNALVLAIRDPNTMTIATATDRIALVYRDRPFRLTGIESPDAVEDETGQKLLRLNWRAERLNHIDLLVPATAEFVAVVTTFCLLHERPTS